MTQVIVQAATGVDLVEAALDAVCGYPDRFPAPAPTRGPVSIRFLVPGRSGVVSALKGLADAQAVPGVVDAAFTITPGRAFERRHSSSDRLGYVITVGDNAPARAEVAIAKMHIEFEARP
ncbi:hypothetical protein [Saccharothrix longispora]|uniref:hypothetical protein n=1 Tax=Saccharothrix longispora TaxID=33920 RepID=UPI0028FD939D|nr:hypothetical protein [Saccharothrix longispora]MDU0294846.1 hypothetical protein [Saccharothrix longispora]